MDLPISRFRDKLVEAIRTAPVTILQGETGSGKTTQLPQFLYQAGFTSQEDIIKKGKRMIACTQPRRVAAMSVAARVADEMVSSLDAASEHLRRLGGLVGYSVRFEDCTSPETRIKFMTDGMLLRECLADPLLSVYSVVILDEAHERTLQTDILLALCRDIYHQRPHDFRLVVASATLEADRLSKYFGDAPIVRIPGRSFPVQTLYARSAVADYVEATLQCILQIHSTEPVESGHILAFLTGQEEIEEAAEALSVYISGVDTEEETNVEEGTSDNHLGVNRFLPPEEEKILPARRRRRPFPPLKICTIYAAMPAEQQIAIFEEAPSGWRKCILATNIAETSLTIQDVAFVVDCGLSKQGAFDARTLLDTLTVRPISQAQAKQRAGRAGRTRPGKCFRLYTEDSFFGEMPACPEPEIRRANLSAVLLFLLSLGVSSAGTANQNQRSIASFPWLDAPLRESLEAALQELGLLGALNTRSGHLTPLGRLLADLPLDPPMARALVAGAHESCLDSVLTVIAMLSVHVGGSPVWYFPPKQNKAQSRHDVNKIHASFAHSSGDHMTLLQVYERWSHARSSADDPFARQWCRDHFIHYRAMKRAFDVREQLRVLTQKLFTPAILALVTPFQANQKKAHEEQQQPEEQRIFKALLAGFFTRIARLDPSKPPSMPYVLCNPGARNLTAALHPSSVLAPDQSSRKQHLRIQQQDASSESQLLSINGKRLIRPTWILYSDLFLSSRKSTPSSDPSVSLSSIDDQDTIQQTVRPMMRIASEIKPEWLAPQIRESLQRHRQKVEYSDKDRSASSSASLSAAAIVKRVKRVN